MILPIHHERAKELPALPTKRNIGYGVKYQFSPEQYTFLERHDIGCSDGYIGMLRAYCGNRTVWQTSAFAPIVAAIAGQGEVGIDIEAMNAQNLAQLHEWVNGLMSLSDEGVAERLNVHLPLFS